MINRRNVVKVAAMSSIALTTLPARGASIDNRSVRELDFSNPHDNLYGLMKLMGDLSGKRTYYFQPGRVFVHRGGELPVHVMNYTGVTIRETRKGDGGEYISRYSGWQLFRDPTSNAVINRWKNPLTGKTHDVEHFALPNRKQTFSINGFKRPPGYAGDFVWFDKPLILPWQILGDSIWVPFDQFSRYTNRAGHERYENAIHTYHGNLSDLQNQEITSAPSSIASQSQSPYYPWMGYGDNTGHLISTSLGKKSSGLDLFPDGFMEDMRRSYPGAFDVQFDWS